MDSSVRKSPIQATNDSKRSDVTDTSIPEMLQAPIHLDSTRNLTANEGSISLKQKLVIRGQNFIAQPLVPMKEVASTNKINSSNLTVSSGGGAIQLEFELNAKRDGSTGSSDTTTQRTFATDDTNQHLAINFGKTLNESGANGLNWNSPSLSLTSPFVVSVIQEHKKPDVANNTDRWKESIEIRSMSALSAQPVFELRAISDKVMDAECARLRERVFIGEGVIRIDRDVKIYFPAMNANQRLFSAQRSYNLKGNNADGTKSIRSVRPLQRAHSPLSERSASPVSLKTCKSSSEKSKSKSMKTRTKQTATHQKNDGNMNIRSSSKKSADSKTKGSKSGKSRLVKKLMADKKKTDSSSVSEDNSTSSKKKTATEKTALSSTAKSPKLSSETSVDVGPAANGTPPTAATPPLATARSVSASARTARSPTAQLRTSRDTSEMERKQKYVARNPRAAPPASGPPEANSGSTRTRLVRPAFTPIAVRTPDSTATTPTNLTALAAPTSPTPSALGTPRTALCGGSSIATTPMSNQSLARTPTQSTAGTMTGGSTARTPGVVTPNSSSARKPRLNLTLRTPPPPQGAAAGGAPTTPTNAGLPQTTPTNAGAPPTTPTSTARRARYVAKPVSVQQLPRPGAPKTPGGTQTALSATTRNATSARSARSGPSQPGQKTPAIQTAQAPPSSSSEASSESSFDEGLMQTGTAGTTSRDSSLSRSSKSVGAKSNRQMSGAEFTARDVSPLPSPAAQLFTAKEVSIKEAKPPAGSGAAVGNLKSGLGFGHGTRPQTPPTPATTTTDAPSQFSVRTTMTTLISGAPIVASNPTGQLAASTSAGQPAASTASSTTATGAMQSKSKLAQICESRGKSRFLSRTTPLVPVTPSSTLSEKSDKSASSQSKKSLKKAKSSKSKSQQNDQNNSQKSLKSPIAKASDGPQGQDKSQKSLKSPLTKVNNDQANNSQKSRKSQKSLKSPLAKAGQDAQNKSQKSQKNFKKTINKANTASIAPQPAQTANINASTKENKSVKSIRRPAPGAKQRAAAASNSSAPRSAPRASVAVPVPPRNDASLRATPSNVRRSLPPQPPMTARGISSTTTARVATPVQNRSAATNDSSAPRSQRTTAAFAQKSKSAVKSTVANRSNAAVTASTSPAANTTPGDDQIAIEGVLSNGVEIEVLVDIRIKGMAGAKFKPTSVRVANQAPWGAAS